MRLTRATCEPASLWIWSGVHGLKHDGKLFTSRSLFESGTAHQSLSTQVGSCRLPAPTHRNSGMDGIRDWRASGRLLLIPIPMNQCPVAPWDNILLWGAGWVALYTQPKISGCWWLFWANRHHVWRIEAELHRAVSRHGSAQHTDYLCQPAHLAIYREFLQEMVDRYWYALPRDVARWRTAS